MRDERTHPAKAVDHIGQAALASALVDFFQFHGSSSSSFAAG
jgi:hypothetical protein